MLTQSFIHIAESTAIFSLVMGLVAWWPEDGEGALEVTHWMYAPEVPSS